MLHCFKIFIPKLLFCLPCCRKDTKQTTQWTRRRRQVYWAVFHERLFAWVLFSFHGWMNDCCLSAIIALQGTQANAHTKKDKSLEAMNTVWESLHKADWWLCCPCLSVLRNGAWQTIIWKQVSLSSHTRDCCRLIYHACDFTLTCTPLFAASFWHKWWKHHYEIIQFVEKIIHNE